MLMNNQVLFVCLWCCVSLDFAIQINFFSLVLFSAVIHKRRGKKLISKTIKYKLDSSSKMQFAFLSKRHSIFFMENYRFCGKSGNEANNKGWGIIFFLRHYDAMCTKIDKWFTSMLWSENILNDKDVKVRANKVHRKHFQKCRSSRLQMFFRCSYIFFDIHKKISVLELH